MLSPEQIRVFRRTGHLTIPDLFGDQQIVDALDDIAVWSKEFLDALPDDERSWYVEQTEANQPSLRKLDNPVFLRTVFQQLAKYGPLVEIVEQVIGPGVAVFFSQVFMKPPGVGGPKPIHQDNYYFGPDDLDATLTVWIALDDATTENGCLFYSDIHQSAVVPHQAPDGEPFNLQMPPRIARRFEMTPAPVPRGGVSLHHGNTPHQSSANRSPHPRRAAAMHYLRNDASLISPALHYDDAMKVQVTG